MKLKDILKLVVIICLFAGCSSKEENTLKNDSQKFKEEYEILNGEKNENNGKIYRSLKIDEDNNFIYKSAKDIIEMMEDEESFVVYFGFSSCPWCRSIIKPLIDVSSDLDIYPIYYVDVKDIRSTIVVNDEGKIEVKKEGTKDYYELLDKMENVLEDYTITDNDGDEIKTGEKRIYAPNIVAVIDGDAVQLTDGISSKQTDGYMDITNEMEKESYDKIKCAIECVLDSKEICSAKKKC